MDKITERNIENGEEITLKKSRLEKLTDYFTKEKNSRAEDSGALGKDLLLFAIGFLFSRAHLLFGAHPIGLAFLSVLPVGVWSALIGCVIGALTMGLDGIIFAAASVIVVFLRAAISCADKSGEGVEGLFKEALLLRMSAAILGGFVAALYEALLSGLNQTTIFFGLAMIILPPMLTFTFSGVFDCGITAFDILHGSKDVFALSGKEDKEKYNLIFFQLSALMLIFFISLSFKPLNLLGISFPYLFCGVITLLVAKRFGAIRAFATGFVSSLGISATYSVAFGLAGLGAGFAFSFGAGYAVILGGAALCAWGAYLDGLRGLLSVLPEYSISAVIAAPILRKISEIKPEIETKELGNSSEDMVGTMALSYQNRFSGSLDSLEIALSSLSGVIGSYTIREREISPDDYREIVIGVAREGCEECSGSALCTREDIRPCIENAEKIAKKLALGEQICAEDVNTDREFCQIASVLADRINRRAAHARQELFSLRESNASSESYRLIAHLMNGARLRDDAERSVDDSMTEALTRVFSDCGFEDGTIRVFGERRRHFILAGEDADGSKITSPELKKSIEKAAGVRLGAPEYFRSGKMALMECGIRRALTVSVGIASSPGDEKEVSGDTVLTFESTEDYFYSLISDGMGRGEEAKKTSKFVTEFMRYALEIGAAKDTLLHLLNHIIMSVPEECSATVDLFELDLLNSEATFLKSGAASSFVKRESSIFRIRSQTAPIGLMKTIDSEKIRVEIKPGDYVIMMSDGVADSSEDAPWLLLLLGEPPKKNLKEYAEAILEEAKKNVAGHDDMSVVVIRVDEI